MVRYLWYALSLAGSPPHLLTWLRCAILAIRLNFSVLIQLVLLLHAACLYSLCG